VQGQASRTLGLDAGRGRLLVHRERAVEIGAPEPLGSHAEALLRSRALLRTAEPHLSHQELDGFDDPLRGLLARMAHEVVARSLQRGLEAPALEGRCERFGERRARLVVVHGHGS
jgi:hypothetical protein